MWFWFWLLFVLLLVGLPSGCGWGYRGWGPPYRPFLPRRRSHGGIGGMPSGRVPPPGAAPAEEIDGGACSASSSRCWRSARSSGWSSRCSSEGSIVRPQRPSCRRLSGTPTHVTAASAPTAAVTGAATTPL